MKVLMLSTKFFHPDGSLWLRSELAKKFLEDGHYVTVLNFLWMSDEKNNLLYGYPNFEIKNIKPFSKGGTIKLFIRWFFSGFKFFPFVWSLFKRRERFDLVIGFSPQFPFYALLPFIRVLSKRSYLIYWDFFPVHNFKIKKPWFKGLEFIFKFIEKKLVHSYDRVGLMSPKNLEFYEEYFGCSKNLTLEVLPLWSSYHNFDAVANLKSYSECLGNSIVLVFGGQLTVGRGVLELCQAAVLANQVDSRIKLFVIGMGDLFSYVLQFSQQYPEVVILQESVSREEYLSILNSCDIGFISTDITVQSPTYPSKSLDYMLCGLPMIAAVEDATDFGSIVEVNKLGLACKANDIDSMKSAILKLAEEPLLCQQMSASAKEFFKKYHYIDNVIEHFYK